MSSLISENIEKRPGGSVAFIKRKSLYQDALSRLTKNKASLIGGIIIALLAITAIFSSKIAPYHFADTVLVDQNQVSSWVVKIFPSMKAYGIINNNYIFGADALGRDLLSRVIYGSRISLTIAIVAPMFSLLIGRK